MHPSLPADLRPVHGNNAQLRVLHVIDTLELGGAQQIILNFIQAEAMQEFVHEAACLHSPGIYAERIRKAGVLVHVLAKGWSKWFPRYLPKLAKLLLARRYDIVHTHLIGSNLPGNMLAAVAGIPVRVAHHHANESVARRPAAVRMVEALGLRAAGHVFTVCQSAHDDLILRRAVPANRLEFLRNGVPIPCLPGEQDRAAAKSEWGFEKGRIVVGGIGRLVWQKNFQLFIKVAAACHAREPRLCFYIAGAGPEEKELQSCACALGLLESGALRFLGQIEDVPRLMDATDLLMMTSRFEGLPMTMLEGMARALPVVATAVDGIRDVQSDPECLRLAAPGNEDDLVEQVCRLAANKSEAETLGRQARVHVERNFSVEKQAARVKTVYLELLTRCREK